MILRILMLISGLVIGVQLLVLNIWGFGVSKYVADEMAYNEEVIAGTADDIAAPEMPGTPFTWWHARVEKAETFSSTTLTDERQVVVVNHATLADVLATGEAAPDPAYHDAYMAARAPGLMIAECENVNVTLGNACDLLSTKIKPLDDGTYRVTAQLAYLPNYRLGDTSPVENGDFVSGATFFTDTHWPKDMPVDTRVLRRNYLSQSVAICAQLRAVYGNCTVSKVELTQRVLSQADLAQLPAGTEPVRLYARASYAIYVNKTEVSFLDVDEKLEELGLTFGL